jgi:hypothetical protein
MSDGKAVGHWHRLEDELHASAQDFYTRLEEAVRVREIPGVEISRILRAEGGLGSPDREYLRVQRGRFAFDVCCAHFGRGTFFSWWFTKPGGSMGVVLALVIALLLFAWFLFLLGASYIFGKDSAGYLILVILIPVSLYVIGLLVAQGIFEFEDQILETPYIGKLYVMVFNPASFYRQDTAIMFRESVSGAVTEVVNEILTAANHPPLTFEARLPTVKDLLG